MVDDAARAQQIADAHGHQYCPCRSGDDCWTNVKRADLITDIAQALADVRAETVREISDDFSKRAKNETVTVKPGLWFATGLLDLRLQGIFSAPCDCASGRVLHELTCRSLATPTPARREEQG